MDYFCEGGNFVSTELVEKFDKLQEPVTYRGNENRLDVARRFVEDKNKEDYWIIYQIYKDID